MTERFLVVVDDSAAALHASRVAIDLAAAVGARLTLVTIVEDHVLDAQLHAAAIPDVTGRRVQGAQAMAARVAAMAGHRGVLADTEVLIGHGAKQVLAAVGRCGAKLIVVAREPQLTAGGRTPPVNVEHLLEFADVPVLVVPAAPDR